MLAGPPPWELGIGATLPLVLPLKGADGCAFGRSTKLRAPGPLKGCHPSAGGAGERLRAIAARPRTAIQRTDGSYRRWSCPACRGNGLRPETLPTSGALKVEVPSEIW